MKFIYLIMLLLASAFHLLYKGDLSFILLVFLAVFPILLFLILLLTSFAVKVSVSVEQPSVSRGKSAVLIIKVKNNSPFAIAAFRAIAEYKALYMSSDNPSGRCTLSASIGARTTERFTINITPLHCGTVDVCIKKVKIRDLIGLFSIPVKVGMKDSLIALPMIYPIHAVLENSFVTAAESNTFSAVKPGDDPSEIFGLREYRDGDNPNRIHWKLSGRSENFIVKELSRPLGNAALIIMDFSGCDNTDDADKVLETAFSLSSMLSEIGTAHTIAYPLKDYSIAPYSITNPDKLIAAMTAICAEIKEVNTDSSFAYSSVTDGNLLLSDGRFAKIIAVTNKTSGAYEQELESICGEARLTVICTGICNDSREDELIRTTEVIYADAEKLSNTESIII